MNSLGLDKSPSKTRVAVAMSGGVDSSATAGLLVEEGYDVTGVTLRLHDYGQDMTQAEPHRGGSAVQDARQVASALGIAHHVIDLEDSFRRNVIDDFADTYLRGETPNPCIRCNQTIKFRDLLEQVQELGADLMATGHYARLFSGSAGMELHRGVDRKRDQSYFLFAIPHSRLDFIRFPLGGMDKTEVRALARRLSLPVASKPDSQDICFVPTGNYAEIIQSVRPGSLQPGDIVHVNGRVLGQHQGVANYTVGQRRGLGVSAPEPLYVVRLEPEAGRVVVGPRAVSLKDRITVGQINWLDDDKIPESGLSCQVRLRSTQEPLEALAFPLVNDRALVRLATPEAGAPGQACVFHAGERVLGGGWIEKEARKRPMDRAE